MEDSFFGNIRLLLWLGALSYSSAFIYARSAILIPSFKKYSSSLFHVILSIGFAFQSLGLYKRGIADQSFPLNNTFEILQIIAWCAIMLEFIMRPAFKLQMLGFFTSALAASLSLTSLLISSLDYKFDIPIDPGNPWIGFHAAIAIFSYGIFALLAVTSSMHLLQHRALIKKRSSSFLVRLPAITELDEINKRLLLMGVSVLTIGVGIGFANWAENPDGVSILKLITALIIWALYLTAHKLRSSKKLLAEQYSWTCLILFSIALLSLWPLSKKNQPVSKDSNNAALIQQ